MKFFEEEADGDDVLSMFEKRIRGLELEDAELGRRITGAQFKRIEVRASMERLKAVRDELFPNRKERPISPWGDEAKD